MYGTCGGLSETSIEVSSKRSVPLLHKVVVICATSAASGTDLLRRERLTSKSKKMRAERILEHK